MENSYKQIISSMTQMIEIILDFRFNPKYSNRNRLVNNGPRFSNSNCCVEHNSSFKIAKRIPLEWKTSEDKILVIEIYLVSKNNGSSSLIE